MLPVALLVLQADISHTFMCLFTQVFAKPTLHTSLAESVGIQFLVIATGRQ